KIQGRKGIHWCDWKDLCSLKEDKGLGFQNLDKFNIAILAKQGWRLINFPNSLLARFLKAKYYPNSKFLNAQLGNLPSLTWKSIWVAKGLLKKGLCWRIGIGDRISVWNDLWISSDEADKLQNQNKNENIKLVSDLIEGVNRTWKTNIIVNTFNVDIAREIIQIPLAKIVHDDFQVWRGEPSSDFSVRSAYKLL
ncbi:hypothetical protein J1N35_044350, partial [Gossypium stocksii]